jgi:tetratricopeptide (TPR) repeat protein
MGLAKRFKQETERAIALDPNNLDARFALMEFYWEAPGIMGGDKKKSYALADEIARLNAVRGYFAQAELANKEKSKDLARFESLYLKAVEADPRSYNARVSLASLYLGDATKKYDLAEKHLREAVKIDPGRSGAYAVLVQAYIYQQRWKELEAALAEAERAAPDDFNYYYQAGRVLLVTGQDLPRAERYFRKYLTQEPEGGAPRHAAAHWRLGLVLEKSGRKPEAVSELETATRLEPDFEPAKKDLKRMK